MKLSYRKTDRNQILKIIDSFNPQICVTSRNNETFQHFLIPFSNIALHTCKQYQQNIYIWQDVANNTRE